MNYSSKTPLKFNEGEQDDKLDGQDLKTPEKTVDENKPGILKKIG